jgi:hypothetical protein
MDPGASYNCTHPYPDCVLPAGFQISDLWFVTQMVLECLNDTRIATANPPALTLPACEGFVGSSSWTWYTPAIIWLRLTSWKVPLITLVALFPHPPLSKTATAFGVVHLLGNPVNTLKNLLLKVASCQRRAIYWITLSEDAVNGALVERTDNGIREIWKALTLIVDAYDEWGKDVGDRAQRILTRWM